MYQFRDGVRKFRDEVFPRKKALFRRLAKAQAPRALFLSCADSRVIPSLLTSTNPGELFMETNPGNLVPVYSEHLSGESACIEYAAAVLNVPEIIICGHSNCGAMKALLNPAGNATIPAVRLWLQFGEPALSILQRDHPDAAEEDALRLLTQINVRLQMQHLRTHPSVQRRVEAGTLDIYGWVYDIPTGTVQAFDADKGEFALWP